MIIQIPLSFSYKLFTSYGFSNLDGKIQKQTSTNTAKIIITKKYTIGDSCTKTNPGHYQQSMMITYIPKYLPLVSFVLILVMYHVYDTHKIDNCIQIFFTANPIWVPFSLHLQTIISRDMYNVYPNYEKNITQLLNTFLDTYFGLNNAITLSANKVLILKAACNENIEITPRSLQLVSLYKKVIQLAAELNDENMNKKVVPSKATFQQFDYPYNSLYCIKIQQKQVEIIL
ncbi:unnamed protein product (macronuclear) [Paramecium tetraurelia]|uniref:Transmembrane protein n=1 Tax=Paramecium tetraurelia TaxID=5888 RepID=A0BB72_PARTE|nr:uncharacterized protein GSPATT00000224001 [Paramecium tetraurelia]CAK55789.1 unnamed protein product [Paramecium tetraurelia]|eukprot:XP_001423187.1 hypothetical protein (macronuclear) [Paramecium tetraurelia strain d4-2]